MMARYAAADALWLDVPFIAQEKNGCGSAALAMVIRYWAARQPGIRENDADAVRIQRELYSPADKGIAGASMQRYLQQHGFRAYVFRAEWGDLRHHLSSGRPLIVCFKPSRLGRLHYGVAAGVDEGTIMLNDPADRKLRKWERPEFEEAWRVTGFWTLLAVPRVEQ